MSVTGKYKRPNVPNKSWHSFKSFCTL